MDLIDKFKKFGFVVVRDAFDPTTCLGLKSSILDYFTNDEGLLLKNTTKNYRDGKQCTAPMAFNNPDLAKLQLIFYNNKLTETLKVLTGNKLVFLHHSDAHVDTVAGKGWHTDAINNSDGRAGKRWKDTYITKDYWTEVDGENYCVIRAAFYLQDHYHDDGGLFVVAGSHNPNSKFNKELYVKTKIGDVILFDARLQHRGGNKVKKGNKRTAIFWAMGRDNVFSQEHLAAAIARQKYQLGLSDYVINKNLQKALKENGIGF